MHSFISFLYYIYVVTEQKAAALGTAEDAASEIASTANTTVFAEQKAAGLGAAEDAAANAAVVAEKKVESEMNRIKEQFDLYKRETQNCIEEMQFQRETIHLLNQENQRKKETIGQLEQVSSIPKRNHSLA